MRLPILIIRKGNGEIACRFGQVEFDNLDGGQDSIIAVVEKPDKLWRSLPEAVESIDRALGFISGKKGDDFELLLGEFCNQLAATAYAAGQRNADR
jgi:hypothetical protein